MAILLTTLVSVLFLGFQFWLFWEAYKLKKNELKKSIMHLTENVGHAYEKITQSTNPLAQHKLSIIDSLLNAEQAFDNFENRLCYAISEPGGEGVYYTSDDVPLKIFNESSYRYRLPILSSEKYPRDLIFAPRNEQTLILSKISSFVFGFLVMTGIVMAALIVLVRQYLLQKQLAELKSDFINNLVHEFRTPMASIRLAAETMEKLLNTESKISIKKYYNVIIDQVDRLQKHVETVLESSQEEHYNLKLDFQKLNLIELLKNAISTVELQFPKARIRMNLNKIGPIILIKGDNTHLTQVFINIFDNALKYNNSSIPRVDVDILRQNGYIRIIFTDNGIGISRRHIKGIFQKFYRVPQGKSHKVKGYGIGLSYVKQIVLRHQGLLFIKSKPGFGTTLEIRIPDPS